MSQVESQQNPIPRDTRRRLLVVEDDDLVLASLRLQLPPDWTITPADSPDDALNLIRERKITWAAALVDMHLTGNLALAEGLSIVRTLRECDPHMEIIAMSGDLDRNLMEQGLKSGASRFLAKPIGAEELSVTLEKIEALLLLREAATGNAGERERIRWIGNSPASQAVARGIASLKGEAGPLLLEGESGTGKEVAALLLHQQESDASRPFIAVNLGAVPESVFESELFGHVKGAFTGAEQNKMGLAEAAHGGDLFLDEVEALPMASQAKLLRFLESNEVRRVGGRDAIRVKVRVIAATNRSLSSMVANGEFREDLLWRLQGKTLRLPPLRERMDDLAALAEFFLQQERPKRNKKLAADAVLALQAHRWSGNVRELKRVCEQLALDSPLPLVRAEDVHACVPHIGKGANATAADRAIDFSGGLNEMVARFEADLIRRVLNMTSDVDKAAERIGISRSSMYKKMKDYGIERG